MAQLQNRTGIKLLQINVTANSGSTGRIAEQINAVARMRGWETYLAYGRNVQPCGSKLIHVGCMPQVYEHYAEHRLFDNDGLASRVATRQLIKKIKEIQPDIIHLHNIHDHWLNFRLLFEYLNTLDTPIVWTQHDCWSFTGGCGHFIGVDCYQWKEECIKCPMKKGHPLMQLFEKTKKKFDLKKQLFTAARNLTLVTVSKWLEGLEKESFLDTHHIVTIHNGIDINAFHPMDSSMVRRKFNIGDAQYIIGVANVWSERKGLNDFVEIAPMLAKNGIKTVLVGRLGKQEQVAKNAGIVAIPQTEDVKELAALYSGALLTCNLSREETFGLTTVESLACGTPGIVYNATASPELVLYPKAIDNKVITERLSKCGYFEEPTGWIVSQGDTQAVCDIAKSWFGTCKGNPSREQAKRAACRERAEKHFNKDDRYEEYMRLYEGRSRKTNLQTTLA